MSITSIPKTGLWTDYSTSKYALVCSSLAGFWLASLAGVWLALNIKYIKDIIASFAINIYLLLNAPGSHQDDSQTETTNLISGQIPAPLADEKREMARLFKFAPGVRDLLSKIFWDHHISWYIRWRLSIFTLAVLAAAMAIVVGGIYSAKLTTDGPALLESEDCGIWLFNEEKHTEEQALRAGVVDLEKETRAASYAKNCYREASTFDAAECDFFYHRAIPFEAPIHSQNCPFSSDVCTNDTTITFSTLLLDSSYIGINSPAPPRFRKRTTCTPLSMDERFIRNVTQNGTTRFYYYYGTRPEHDPPADYTYETAGDPYDKLVPAYDVFAYTTTSTNRKSYWNPIPELGHPKDSTLTIIFISSLGILYKGRSVDPLFPADEEVMLPGHKQPLFRNSDPRARPFACIDEMHLCLADGINCWPLYGKSPDDVNPNNLLFPPEFWLMYGSFLKTNTFYTIIKRLGRAFLAQELVSDYQSQALANDHWEVEMDNFFATSLARSQYDAWSIASAEDQVHQDKDGYFRASNDSEVGNLCGIYKFRPTSGYVSVSFWPFLVVCLTTPFFFGLSRQAWGWTRIKQEWKEWLQALRSFDLGEAMGFALREEPASGQSTRPQSHQSPAAGSSTDTEAQIPALNPPAGPSTTNAGLFSTQPTEQSAEDFSSVINAPGTGVGSDHSRPPESRASSARQYGTITAPEIEASSSTAEEEIIWEPLVIDILIYWSARLIGWILQSIGWIFWAVFWVPAEGIPRAYNAVVARLRQLWNGDGRITT
ncbi:hypothetical protein B0J11DRAFT_344884 [Dendryphion nanum]|uniref:Uncharacterized protein n=1 Tax=Dendryphion nanum TaxID=256645 RepID=A0A9P9DQ87_9PLEO|nr:hypothetical protein B0J11DRAFT_344884 [Dendryphion nanum]